MQKQYFCLLIIVLIFSKCSSAQSARFAGMGNSSLTLFDTWSATGNQAGLANLEIATFAIGYENKFQLTETSTQAAIIAFPSKSGNFALSLNRYGYHLYSENSVGIAYARKLGEYISAALQFDYLYYQQAANYGNKNLFMMEAGLIAKPFDNFFIGAHIYNPTRVKLADYEQERVPTIMRFGLGYYFSNQVLFTVETEKNIYNKARFKAGIEYEPINHLFFRTGFGTNPNQYSFGLGYEIWNFTTDIAVVTHEWLPLSTEISISYSFKNN